MFGCAIRGRCLAWFGDHRGLAWGAEGGMKEMLKSKQALNVENIRCGVNVDPTA